MLFAIVKIKDNKSQFFWKFRIEERKYRKISKFISRKILMKDKSVMREKSINVQKNRWGECY